jgi:hypothetical protein
VSVPDRPRICLTISSRNSHSVTVEIEPSDDLDYFFRCKTLINEYSVSIETLSDGILIIPTVLNLCHLAWLTNAELRVSSLDKRLAAVLPKLRNAFANLYPNYKFTGTIVADSLTETEHGDPRNRGLLLFSGGVDSTFTFFQNLNRIDAIVTVNGADIDLGNCRAWQKVSRQNAEFARIHNKTYISVTSNFKRILNYSNLRKKFARKGLWCWWSYLQHGLGFLGLVAPISVAQGFDKVLFASTDEYVYGLPWGSHPSVDSLAQWSNTEVLTEGDNWTRLDKIRYIVRLRQPVNLRSCWRDESGGNCCVCRDCIVDVASLLTEDANPSAYGYLFDGITPESTLAIFKPGTVMFRSHADEADYHLWIAVQEILRGKLERGADFGKFQHFAVKIAELRLEDYFVELPPRWQI